MKFSLLIALTLALVVPAGAQQHNHGQKGPNGGQLQDVAGVHLELVASGTELTFYVLDEANKPISSKGFTASALISSGSDRETLTLTPQVENLLKGSAKKSVVPGTVVSITLKTPAGKSGQARYKY